MIGGNGPRRTMGLIARYGYASNFGVPDPGESRRLVDAIHRECAAIGRHIEQSVLHRRGALSVVHGAPR